MGILKDNQMIFFTDSKYNDVFDTFNKKESKNKIEIKQLYILAAAVGFKNSKRVQIENKGKETRTSYLSYKEEALLLNMVFADSEIDNNIDEIVNLNNKMKIKNIIDEYANGGLELIVESGLSHRWNGEFLNNEDGNLTFDLSKYILSEVQNIPF
ncbi:hypothetical protein QI297_10125 [Staphylococcus saprophyticus]|nr:MULTISPECIES: hypothetical protein [Staphylococcus]MBM0843799.1 hypothetical protein [Staphylococcus saprophyticus]MBO0383278.1 hypothetical protein [Staphylococcus saprophyticus]MCD9063352.1 hypothetical protein [Staphylococcus saprophyticus]MDT3968593.1 hypothetical protein [Staphylococcus saprophyticus]MDT3979001.1 hypothetical protein [Staphylococcus saprophyticus]